MERCRPPHRAEVVGIVGGERWAGGRRAAGKGPCSEEGQHNAELAGAAYADGCLHEQFPWVASGLVHASDDLRLHRIDQRAEVDSCHAAIEGLQAGSGELQVLHESPRVPTAATAKQCVTKCTIRLTIS